MVAKDSICFANVCQNLHLSKKQDELNKIKPNQSKIYNYHLLSIISIIKVK